MRGCASCRGITRREALQSAPALVALLAMARRGEARVEQAAVTPRGTAKICVFVNLVGAPSHLDTFDAKDAPWNPPDANLQDAGGGVVLSRTFFPELSKLSSELLLVRSVSSWEAAHERGQFYLQTAHPANPAFVAETPNIGSVVSLERATQVEKLPAFLSLNSGGSGGAFQSATFLGGRHEPLYAPSGSFSTIRHDFFGSSSQQRFDERFALLRQLTAQVRAEPPDPRLAAHTEFYDAARPLMYDASVEAVFNVTAEERQRYGGNGFGDACVVARNAVRAANGVSFIHLANGGWDTHQAMFDKGYPGNFYELTARLDRGVGLLAQELRDSGHLKDTLILIMGEFGRTPGPLNSRGGRDHHRDAMAVAMLGGGVKGGRVLGATDSQGARVVDTGWRRSRPIYPEDLTATIYSALGINWTKRILETPTGRIFEYVPGSSGDAFSPVDEVFS